MAMVNVVYWLPLGGLLAQVNWFGSKVSSHWCCFCSHRVNSQCSKYNDSTINIVQVLLLYYYYYRMPCKFRDISNGTQIIMLTNTQMDTSEKKQYYATRCRW